MHRLLFFICAVAVTFYTAALAQTCNPVVTSDRTGLNGTTPSRAWDGNNVNYFQSSYNDWQYLQVDFNCTGQFSSLRRYMTKNGSTAGARADQGEAVSCSLDGVNWVNVAVASTTGWQGYTPYSPIAWKRVPYGMSAWLRLNAPVQARFVRFRRHTGGVFQQHTSGTTARLGSIFVTSVNGAWVSSSEAENTLLQWNPAWVPAWQKRSEVVHQDHLYGMAGPFSRNEVWATGSQGAIIYSQDRGMTWRTLHVASGVTNVTLFSVVVTPQRHIWAAGFGTGASGNLESVVVHYNGVIWQNHYTGDNHILNRVAASTARHAWAVGASRTILYTDTSGQTWTRQAIPANVPPGNFLDVLAVSETEAWGWSARMGSCCVRRTAGRPGYCSPV